MVAQISWCYDETGYGVTDQEDPCTVTPRANTTASYLILYVCEVFECLMTLPIMGYRALLSGHVILSQFEATQLRHRSQGIERLVLIQAPTDFLNQLKCNSCA